MGKTFVGFGFGAIQGGLFLPEAYRSGNFSRLVVSEIDVTTVEQIRKSKGNYACNVAEPDHIRLVEVTDLEILNPLIPEDREKLVDAIASANELCTALPSYTLYDAGGQASVASLLAEGLQKKLLNKDMPTAVVYAAENDGRAAARLKKACQKYVSTSVEGVVSFSETVIAKMCSVVTDSKRIAEENLAEVTPGSSKSFLVEAFDQILIEEKKPDGFDRGITQFIPKPNLDPFALTKFHGHNAIHYCLGIKAKEKGMKFMHQAGKDSELMDWAREAFVKEAGVGLRNQFSGFPDVLFSEKGFAEYAEDALHRMVNPYLRDPIDRVTRDPIRKLGWDDRLVGSIRYAIKAGVNPQKMLEVTRRGLEEIKEVENTQDLQSALDLAWQDQAMVEEMESFRNIILRVVS
jgi:mannitol-1-phosphate 5-dehydrogenase